MVAALLAALPFVLPAGLYKEPDRAKRQPRHGRSFKIAGSLHFTLYPTLGISAQQVSLANPAGWTKPVLATAEELRIAVRLRPLLAGRIEISEIAIERPQIELAVDAAGHANWTLARGRAKPAAKGGGVNGAFTTSFSHMTVDGGNLTYSNARTKSAFAIGEINAQIAGQRIRRTGVARRFVFLARPESRFRREGVGGACASRGKDGGRRSVAEHGAAADAIPRRGSRPTAACRDMWR